MNPGQRISYIKDISRSLGNYSWPEIDLILEQFGLPTSDNWAGDKNSYGLEHIKRADDKVLQELNIYLTNGVIEDENEEVSSDRNNLWLPNKFRLFISHLAENMKEVSGIKEHLSAYGIDCFVAHQDIEPTAEWQNTIESALRTCDAATAILTGNFHKSNWTDQEIGFCVARRILIIPVKISIDPYGFIAKYQAKNCHGHTYSQVAEEIFSILIGNSLTSESLSKNLVASFVESSSYKEAKTLSLLLTKIRNWTPELLRSIEGCLETNRQISEAIGVPERLKIILDKYSR